MKPPPFDYMAPTDLDQALSMLAAGGDDTRPLAGGQSLIPMLNFRLARPAALIDLNGVTDLARIEERPDGGITLGAMTRQRDLELSPVVAARAPLLREASPWIAHAQIRTRGTVGGSVAHADPAAELPALLLVLGATVRAARAPREGETGARVERAIPLEEFFYGPFFTVLEPEELIVAIDIAAAGRRQGTAFEEVARRRGDYAIVGATARVTLDEDGMCSSAALVLINAGPAPALMPDATRHLCGHGVTAESIEAAATAAAEQARPVSDMHGSERYRRHLVRVLTERTLTEAARRAAGADNWAGEAGP